MAPPPKPALRLLFVAATALILAAVYLFHVRKDMTDFGVCYLAGERIIEGETLYRAADEHLQFKYSPASALFFAPFSLLPYEAAKPLWYALSCFFAAGAFFLSFRLLPAEKKRPAGLLILTFLIVLKFQGREIELGQANLLIIFALTLMLASHLRGQATRAGLLWGFSLFFKPYALVFAPYLALKKSFRTLATGLAVFLAGLALPGLFYGWSGNLRVLGEWPRTLSRSTAGLLSVYDNGSLFAFLLKALPPTGEGLAEVIFGLAVALLAAGFLWMIRRGTGLPETIRPEILECSFLFILIPFLSPLGWYYNYLYSLLAVMLLLSAMPRFSPPLRTILIVNFIVISTSIIEIWGRELFEFYTRSALVAVNYLVILLALAYLRMRKAA